MISLLLIIILLGCPNETLMATFWIQNKVSNSVISGLHWGDYGIYEKLMPGETSSSQTITDEEKFGKHRLEFYLNAKNNSVYLETAEVYSLHDGDEKKIIIDDNTLVINPIDVRSNIAFSDDIVSVKEVLMSR